MFYFFVKYKTNFLESSLTLVYKFDHSITYNLVIPFLGIRAKGKIFIVYVQWEMCIKMFILCCS